MKAKFIITMCSLLLMALFLDTNKAFAMDLPQASENQLIYVKTNDDHLVPVELWKIKEMRSLDIALQDQQNQEQNNYNNEENPIYAPMINFDELTLLQNALDAVSKNEFSNFFQHQYQLQQEPGKPIPSPIRQLINAAQHVQANQLSALCLTEISPKGIMPNKHQKQIINPFIKGAVNFFKNRMIARSAFTKQKTIGNVPGAIFVSCSNDNRTIAFSEKLDGYAFLYDLVTGAEIRPIKTSPSITQVEYVSFSPDGTKVAIIGGGGAHTIEIQNTTTGELLQTIKTTVDGIATFSPVDNNLLLWRGYNNNECCIYNISNGSIVQDFANLYQGPIRKAFFSSDGKMLLILGENPNHLASLWDVATGKFITNLHNDRFNNASFSRDGKYIILTSPRVVWMLVNIENINKITSRSLANQFPDQYQTTNISTAQFLPDSKSILLTVKGKYQLRGELPSKIIIWNFENNEIIFDANIPEYDQYSTQTIISSPDGRWIIMAKGFNTGSENALIAWNIFTEEDEKTLALFNNLNAAQARFVYKLCPSETPDFSKQQELYQKLFRLRQQELLYQQPAANDVDFALFKTLPKKIQSLFLESLLMPNTPPSQSSTECIGNECTIL